MLAGCIVLALVALLAAGAAWLSRPPLRRGSGDLRLHRLGDGTWLYRGYFSNSVVFVLPRGVVVVDTQVSPLAAARLRAEIERVTDLPIRYVVNTHYHGDHTGGNAVFPEAETIGTEGCLRFVHERDDERREYAETFGLVFEDYHPTAPPTRTFSGRLVLDDLGEPVEILQLGRAETPDACVVHLPARRAIATGDGVATIHYPYLGVPLLDEGLRPDGEWVGYLQAIRDLRPTLLLPGHGIALAGERRIAARLDLLVRLYRDLLGAVERELAAGTPIPALVERVDRELAHYKKMPELEEYTVSQRFAIYRCVNNLSPDRRGKGWWHDLRPSILRRASVEEGERELAGGGDVLARAAALAGGGRRPLAIALLEAMVRREPERADAWALLSDVLFDGSRGIRPTVDATEYISAATRAAREALARDPDSPLGLLTLGIAEVFGAMVLAQPMARGIARIERSLASGRLDRVQRQKARFFLGKAHQLELRPAQADGHYRQALPGPLRPLFPLLRQRIYAYP
jgi:cyclase